jgi:hypothetical protein
MPALTKPNAIQKARLEQSRATWQPPGTSVQIHGRTIPGGMLYVGPRVTGLFNGRPIEPALIDPTFKARRRQEYAYPRYNAYWQLLSYHKLSPNDRAEYLDWLAAGRPENPTYEQVLLFFYGIERRIMFDARYDEQALDEIPVLLDEVDRVVAGFHTYSVSNLRTAASNLRAAGETRLPGFDPTSIDPPMSNGSWELPLAIQLALGTFAMQQRPLPPRWAYSWAACSPYAHLTTVERRCPNEFAEYFALRYHQAFGEGVLLPNRNDGSSLTYRPLSPSFQRPLQVGPREFPIIGQAVYGNAPLIDLIRGVSTDLEPFSRMVLPGRSSTPLSAYGLLPEGMPSLAANARVTPLLSALETALQHTPSVLVEKASLLSFFPEIATAPTPTQSTGISRLFQRLGFGIEPDPAAMRTPFLRAERVGIYRRDFGEGNFYENRDLSRPLALLSMWSYLAAADGPIQERTGASVCALLVSQSDLEPFEINRLQAHTAWLTQHPASLGDARRRFGVASLPSSDATARTIVAMSLIDALMTPARIKALSKIYGVIGLTSEQLHADIHRMSTQHVAPSQKAPTQIMEGDRISGFGIPAPPDPHQIDLDATMVAAVQAQTDSIAVLLHDIFASGDSGRQAEPDPGETSVEADPYIQLVHLLASRPTWSLDEFTEMAASVGLMASGAIETLNDRAIGLGLEPLLDCDEDVCDCYEPTLKELLAHV